MEPRPVQDRLRQIERPSEFPMDAVSRNSPSPSRPRLPPPTPPASRGKNAPARRVKIPGASSGAFDPATHHVHPTLANPGSHERERLEARRARLAHARRYTTQAEASFGVSDPLRMKSRRRSARVPSPTPPSSHRGSADLRAATEISGELVVDTRRRFHAVAVVSLKHRQHETRLTVAALRPAMFRHRPLHRRSPWPLVAALPRA